MVKKAKNYIFEGDIFQVVLSQRFKTQFLPSPFELYRSLRSLNPSPFLFYMNLEESIKEAGIDEANKDLAMVVKETELAVLNENDHYSDLKSGSESFENQSLKKNKT